MPSATGTNWLRAATRIFFANSIFNDPHPLDLIARRANEHLLRDIGIRRTIFATENPRRWWL